MASRVRVAGVTEQSRAGTRARVSGVTGPVIRFMGLGDEVLILASFEVHWDNLARSRARVSVRKFLPPCKDLTPARVPVANLFSCLMLTGEGQVRGHRTTIPCSERSLDAEDDPPTRCSPEPGRGFAGAASLGVAGCLVAAFRGCSRRVDRLSTFRTGRAL